MKVGLVKNRILRVLRLFLGRRNVERLLLARNCRKYRATGITFIHVPKNAGTSVSRSLYGGSLGHFTARQIDAFDPSILKSTTSFAILRDPVDRAISAWRYCITGGPDGSWRGRWPEFALPEFLDFERFATEWLPRQDPATLNFVLRRQTDFLCDAEGKLMVDRLVHMDRVAEGLRDVLGDRADDFAELRVLNKTTGQRKDRTELSDTALAAIRSYYAADVALYDAAEDAG